MRVRRHRQRRAEDRRRLPGGVASALCGLLRGRGGRDRVLASSFDPAALRTVRALRPDIPTALVVEPDGDLGVALREVTHARHRALHPNAALVDHSLVERARTLGLALHVWTVTTRTNYGASPDSAWTG